MSLRKYLEKISNDFQSTFILVDDNTLANMMSEKDLDEVTRIIKKYIPTAQVSFIKTNQLKNTHDIYLIKVAIK